VAKHAGHLLLRRDRVHRRIPASCDTVAASCGVMAVSLEPAPWAWPTMAAPCGAAGSCRFEGCGGAAG
jgi:hypothetical protein